MSEKVWVMSGKVLVMSGKVWVMSEKCGLCDYIAHTYNLVVGNEVI